MGTSWHRSCLCLLRFATSYSPSLWRHLIHQHVEQQLFCYPAEIFGAALEIHQGPGHHTEFLHLPKVPQRGRWPCYLPCSTQGSSKDLRGPIVGIPLQQHRGHPSLQGQAQGSFVSPWTAGSLPEKEEQDDFQFSSLGAQQLSLPEAQLISPSSEVHTQTTELERTTTGNVNISRRFYLSPPTALIQLAV